MYPVEWTREFSPIPELRTVNRKRLSAEELDELNTDEASIIKLKNEVVYLHAEVELLKKSHNRQYPGSEASSDGHARK